MTSADFPWFWKFVMQSQQSTSPSLVLCIEDCLYSQADAGTSKTQLSTENSPGVVVSINGKPIRGGTASHFPSGMIFLDHPDASACLRLLLVSKLPSSGGDAMHDIESDTEAAYFAEFAMRDLTAFGSPLFTSLWLGLADSSQDSSLGGCLDRARGLDAPKLKITLFDRASLSSLQSVTAGVLPRPNVRLSLHPSEDDEGSCFSTRTSRDDREVSEAVQSVEGLIRCLDESNNTVAYFHKHGQAASPQLEESLRQFTLERERWIAEQNSLNTQLGHMCEDAKQLQASLDLGKSESANKDEAMHTLHNQLQQLQSQASELRAVHEQAKQDHARELLQKTEHADSLEQKLESARADIGSMQINHEQEKQTNAAAMCQKVSELQDLDGKLQQSCSQIIEVQTSNEDQRKKMIIKNEEIDSLQKELQRIRNDIVECTAQHQSAQQSHIREIKQKDGYISAVSTQLQQGHAQIEGLKQERDQTQAIHSRDIQNKNQDLEALNSELGRLRAEVADLQIAQEKAYANHAREANQKNDDINSLQKQLKQAHAQVATLQTAQDEAQQKHCREIIQKNEDIDDVQKQLRQTHAYAAEVQAAQDRTQQNHSREVNQKNEDLASLRKQLLQERGQTSDLQAQVHAWQTSQKQAGEDHMQKMSEQHAANDALRLQLRQVEEALDGQSRNADEIVQRQQNTIRDLEQRLAAAIHTHVAEPVVQTPIQEPICSPTVELVSEPTAPLVHEPLKSGSMSTRTTSSLASSVVSSTYSGSKHSVGSFRSPAHLTIPMRSPVVVTRLGGGSSPCQQSTPTSLKPIGEPFATNASCSPRTAYTARSPVATSSCAFQFPTATKTEY